jgi:hypothetical protein
MPGMQGLNKLAEKMCQAAPGLQLLLTSRDRLAARISFPTATYALAPLAPAAASELLLAFQPGMTADQAEAAARACGFNCQALSVVGAALKHELYTIEVRRRPAVEPELLRSLLVIDLHFPGLAQLHRLLKGKPRADMPPLISVCCSVSAWTKS